MASDQHPAPVRSVWYISHRQYDTIVTALVDVLTVVQPKTPHHACLSSGGPQGTNVAPQLHLLGAQNSTVGPQHRTVPGFQFPWCFWCWLATSVSGLRCSQPGKSGASLMEHTSASLHSPPLDLEIWFPASHSREPTHKTDSSSWWPAVPTSSWALFLSRCLSLWFRKKFWLSADR